MELDYSQLRGIKSGRYSNRLPRDIAERVQQLLEATQDTREEEALVRWMISEFLDAFTNGEITKDQFYTNLLAGMESLSRAYERREKLALAKSRVITPEEFVRLVALLGDIVQRRVSNMRERQLVAADFASLIQGHTQRLRSQSDYDFRGIPETTEPSEIIENAIIKR